MLPYTTPLSSASSSVRNSLRLTGMPALRTVKKNSKSTAGSALVLEERLEAGERRGPVGLLPGDRRRARELAVLDVHRALRGPLLGEIHDHARPAGLPCH